jgi:hypothetical protein
LLDDVFGYALLRMSEEIVPPTQLLDHICRLGGLRTRLFDRRSGHHGHSPDAFDLLHRTRKIVKLRAKTPRTRWAALRNDSVSESDYRLIVPSRAATSTARSASRNYELVTATPASVPRQPRGERYSKTSRRQFARTPPAFSIQSAHQLRMRKARIAFEDHLASLDALLDCMGRGPGLR